MTTDFDKYAEPVEHQCPKCGAAPDERWDCCQTHAATAAVNAYGAGQADAVAWQDIAAVPDHDENFGVGCDGPDPGMMELGLVEDLRARGFTKFGLLRGRGAAHPPAASARIAELEAALQNTLPLIQAHVQHDSHDEYTAVAGMISAALTGAKP